MDSIIVIVDLFITGFGVYLMYSAYKLGSKGEIASSVFLSKDLQFKKCRDLEGYKQYMVNKTMISGGIMTVLGGLTVYDDLTGGLGRIGLFIFIPIMADLVWFGIFSRKGQNQFYI